MKCNYQERAKSKFEQLPRIEREEISRFVFKSATKSLVAIVLFRCEKMRQWKKADLKKLYDDLVSLFQMEFFGKQIADTDLIKRYEDMLGVDFDIFDDIVEVKV